MNDTALRSTLREMHALARDRRSWVVLAVLSLIVGLIGPFGTFELGLVPRLLYWAAVVLGTAAAGTACVDFLVRALARRFHPLLTALFAGAVAGLPVTLVVVLVNLLAFGPSAQPINVLSLALYCMAITAAVTVLVAFFDQRQAAPPDGVAPDVLPPLLDRLPLPQRGKLLHLGVADHYVEVTTDRGATLLLLRLSDAIRETAPVRGLQVHRSHWVALDAVRRATRQAGKPMLELTTGALVPVSRSYMAEARAAGLFAP